LYGTNEIVRNGEAVTAEKSRYLKWSQDGYFEHDWESFNQGLRFQPNYQKAIAFPPYPSTVPSFVGMVSFGLHSPANLGAYDSAGRHVGYNVATGALDLEIPDALYLFSQNAQYIVIFQPTDTYELLVTGTGEGSYTLDINWQSETGYISTIGTFSGMITKDATFAYTVSVTPTAEPVVQPDPVADLKQLKTLINSLPSKVFNEKIMSASKMKKILSSKIDEIILKVEAGDYAQAIDKLRNDIRAKMDGDSTAQDWIIDPTTQFKLCLIIGHIIESINILQDS